MKNYSRKLARKLFIQNFLLVIENIRGWLNLIDKLIKKSLFMGWNTLEESLVALIQNKGKEGDKERFHK